MTSGYMECPKCHKDAVQGSDYVNGVWTQIPEPWTCSNCGEIVVVDKQKGYGLMPIFPSINKWLDDRGIDRAYRKDMKATYEKEKQDSKATK